MDHTCSEFKGVRADTRDLLVTTQSARMVS